MSDSTILKYIQYQIIINPSFWYKLTQVKLDIDKLHENHKHIWGWFTNVKQHNLPILEIDCTSFNTDFSGQKNYFPVHGFILNKNTIEQFKDCSKLELIENEGLKIVENFKTKEILEDPSLLNTFFVLSFADLKKYHYYFWFAFPTPNLNVFISTDPKKISECFNKEQVNNLMLNYNNISDIRQKSFFVVKQGLNNEISILTLNNVLTNNDFSFDKVFFAFSDPSSSEFHPGWPMRNYVALLLYFCPNLQNKSIDVLSLRLEQKQQQFSCDNSIIFKINFPVIEDKNVENFIFGKNLEGNSPWIGWQKNERGKFGPKMIDMSSNMDPIKLAENSVDLNLKLMKWRLLPEIDLEKIKDTKFLLFGAGTLGCSVARNLLAWGAKNISLVDNGKVSFSNPVRQNLFFHEDCLKGGKLKAIAAAENLKKIFPSVNSNGYEIKVPMPGHSIGESTLEETKKNVEQIIELISSHDVIFLLMDSRESRWLPTMLGAHFNKTVLNAALGFDTYLVMRHGSNARNCSPENKNVNAILGRDLGCYFCNDVTAPGNSLKDRTLDQQCTVTRPGASPMAAALVVELAVSILQHKDGNQAPAYLNTDEDDTREECLLGLLPHSIRGFLFSFLNVLPATRRFQKCIACSDIVLEEYQKNDFNFLLQVFNSSKYLEDLTGLTELHVETDATEIWEICSSEDSN